MVGFPSQLHLGTYVAMSVISDIRDLCCPLPLAVHVHILGKVRGARQQSGALEGFIKPNVSCYGGYVCVGVGVLHCRLYSCVVFLTAFLQIRYQ